MQRRPTSWFSVSLFDFPVREHVGQICCGLHTWVYFFLIAQNKIWTSHLYTPALLQQWSVTPRWQMPQSPQLCKCTTMDCWEVEGLKSCLWDKEDVWLVFLHSQSDKVRFSVKVKVQNVWDHRITTQYVQLCEIVFASFLIFAYLSATEVSDHTKTT